MQYINRLRVLALFIAFTPLADAADLEAGKALASQVCQACHGLDGNSPTPQFPRLGGQHADYMEHTLRAYQSGKRVNPIMAGQAANLSDEDIRNVSAWYASQSGLITPDMPATVR